MGLDQYLRARTNTIEQKSSRGACGGLFPIAPTDKGTTEIGYWRKAYAVSDYLRQVLEIYDDFNLEDKEIWFRKALRSWQSATTKRFLTAISRKKPKSSRRKSFFAPIQRANRRLKTAELK